MKHIFNVLTEILPYTAQETSVRLLHTGLKHHHPPTLHHHTQALHHHTQALQLTQSDPDPPRLQTHCTFYHIEVLCNKKKCHCDFYVKSRNCFKAYDKPLFFLTLLNWKFKILVVKSSTKTSDKLRAENCETVLISATLLQIWAKICNLNRFVNVPSALNLYPHFPKASL